MKLEIYRDKPKEAEKITRLKLIPVDDEVCLAAVDENGKILSYLLSFKNNGSISSHFSIDSSLGFKLSINGGLIIE